jgi:DNA-binding MarR family transcriptional regulator
MRVALRCYCATLRRAARIASQRYDAALRSSGLTVTQFTLLTILSELPEARVNDLAEALAMDQTTLSRTLKLMERARLIARVSGEDRRESRWVLTPRGKDNRRRALPQWQSAQRDFERSVGAATARRLAGAAFAMGERLSP